MSLRSFGKAVTRAAFGRQGRPDAEPLPDAEGAELLESIPSEQEEVISASLEPGEETRVRVLTDIGPDGNFARRWLLITDRRFLVVDENGGTPFSLPLERITSARTRDFVGSGILEVVADGKGYDAVRYTRGVAPRINRAATLLRRGEGREPAAQAPPHGEDQP